eukprot:4249366-Pyramimonas_sp.AAC.1
MAVIPGPGAPAGQEARQRRRAPHRARAHALPHLERGQKTDHRHLEHGGGRLLGHGRGRLLGAPSCDAQTNEGRGG